MDETVKTLLIYLAIPVALAVCRWLYSLFKESVLDRLDRLETALHRKLEEQEVRQLLSDKIDPIREDIQDQKQMLEKILDIVMRK